jgi:hypothetical protein
MLGSSAPRDPQGERLVDVAVDVRELDVERADGRTEGQSVPASHVAAPLGAYCI